MRRTNSCQSDSSGFQEEPTEPLLLQSLHESLNLSSDSIDSQATLTGKNVSSPFQEDYTEETKTANHPAEYGECIRSSFDSIAHANKEIAKLSTMDTNTSEEVFQSFEKQADGFNNNTNQEEYEEELKQNNDQNEIASNNGEFVNDASMLQECEQEEQVDMDASETKFPVYRMHYLSKTIASHNNDESSVVHKNTLQDNLGCCVSELKKKNNIDYNQLIETDCCLQSSINLPEVTHTPPPINELLSSAILGPDNYVQYLADEIEFCQKSKKSTFQTEVNTNIYKSVTIQMSSNLMSDLPSTNTSECLNRQYSFYTTKADRNEHCMLNLNTQKKEALGQTGIRTWGHSCTSNHCMLHRNCFPTESLSFDRGVYDLHHHHHHNHQALRCSCNHCCHSCHRHHCCCSRFPSVYKHNGTMIEKELTDTLKLLKESLTNVSMHTDHDLEHMKNSCRVFKDKLIEIEHVLNKQQAGCWTTLSSEGWEEVRRLHLLRRSVLKEVSELELRLDEREWHVKEALSKQLDQVLEEQSRLYSELDLSDWESENKLYDRNDKPLQMKSFTASAPASYEDISQDTHTNVTMENETKGLTLPQKMDFSAILQNIKKTFKRF